MEPGSSCFGNRDALGAPIRCHVRRPGWTFLPIKPEDKLFASDPGASEPAPDLIRGCDRGAKLRLMPSSWYVLLCRSAKVVSGWACIRPDALVGGGVKSPLLEAMGFGSKGAGSTVSLQELFDKRDADAKEFGDSAPSCLALLASRNDFLRRPVTALLPEGTSFRDTRWP